MDLSIQYFVRIILIWLLCLLSVLLHESGHALGYRISGGKAGWKVVVGSGPRLISISRFTFGLIPAGGNFVPAEEPETDKGQIIMLAGGPFLSLLQAFAAGYSVLDYLFLHFRECSVREQSQ